MKPSHASFARSQTLVPRSGFIRVNRLSSSNIQIHPCRAMTYGSRHRTGLSGWGAFQMCRTTTPIILPTPPRRLGKKAGCKRGALRLSQSAPSEAAQQKLNEGLRYAEPPPFFLGRLGLPRSPARVLRGALTLPWKPSG